MSKQVKSCRKAECISRTTLNLPLSERHSHRHNASHSYLVEHFALHEIVNCLLQTSINHLPISRFSHIHLWLAQCQSRVSINQQLGGMESHTWTSCSRSVKIYPHRLSNLFSTLSCCLSANAVVRATHTSCLDLWRDHPRNELTVEEYLSCDLPDQLLFHSLSTD
jgi:hypothetical protein